MVVGLLDEGKWIEKVRVRDDDEGVEDYEKIEINGISTPLSARDFKTQELENLSFAYFLSRCSRSMD